MLAGGSSSVFNRRAARRCLEKMEVVEDHHLSAAFDRRERRVADDVADLVLGDARTEAYGPRARRGARRQVQAGRRVATGRRCPAINSAANAAACLVLGRAGWADEQVGVHRVVGGVGQPADGLRLSDDLGPHRSLLASQLQPFSDAATDVGADLVHAGCAVDDDPVAAGRAAAIARKPSRTRAWNSSSSRSKRSSWRPRMRRSSTSVGVSISTTRSGQYELIAHSLIWRSSSIGSPRPYPW